MEGLRWLFVDMNSFFTSVEQQERVSLRGQPVAVAPLLTESTCCIAASYEAKGYGIRTGTPVWEAKRRCPHLHVVEARVRLYVAYHHRIVEAVESCLAVDEVCSIDEMAGRLMGRERDPEGAAELAFEVKEAVRQRVGVCVRCSIGVASNAWLAKVGSDLHKPDGLAMILPEQMPEAIGHLSLTDLPGIAGGMERRLGEAGITSVAGLCKASEPELARAWGSRALGTLWWHRLRGHDLGGGSRRRRTVGHSHVLPPTWRTEERARAGAVRLLHKAAARLRRLGYRAGEVVLSLRYLDGRRWDRRAGLGLCRDTLTMARALEPLWSARPAGEVLKVGVVLTHLVPEEGATLPLYESQVHLDGLADCMDRIDRKYGQHTVYLGGMWGAQQTAPTRISFTQIPEWEDFGPEE